MPVTADQLPALEQSPILEKNSFLQPLQNKALWELNLIDSIPTDATVRKNRLDLEQQNSGAETAFLGDLDESVREEIKEAYKHWGEILGSKDHPVPNTKEAVSDCIKQWLESANKDLDSLNAKSPVLKNIAQQIYLYDTANLTGKDKNSLQQLYDLYNGRTDRYLTDEEKKTVKIADLREAISTGISMNCHKEIIAGMYGNLFPTPKDKDYDTYTPGENLVFATLVARESPSSYDFMSDAGKREKEGKAKTAELEKASRDVLSQALTLFQQSQIVPEIVKDENGFRKKTYIFHPGKQEGGRMPIDISLEIYREKADQLFTITLARHDDSDAVRENDKYDTLRHTMRWTVETSRDLTEGIASIAPDEKLDLIDAEKKQEYKGGKTFLEQSSFSSHLNRVKFFNDSSENMKELYGIITAGML